MEQGGVPVLQLKDVPAEGPPDSSHLMRVELGGDVARYLVRCGDVVFRSRGDRNTAAALDERFAMSAVAILPLMVLRPRAEVIDAGYLAWAINQPAAQRHFDVGARGTNMRMVPRSSLDTLEVDVPDLATQRAIAAVDGLADRERDLAVRVADLRRQTVALILGDRARKTGLGSGRERNTK